MSSSLNAPCYSRISIFSFDVILFIPSFIHSCFLSSIHPFILLFDDIPFIHLLIHSFIHSLFHPFILSFIHLLIHSFFLSFIHFLFILSFVHPFIHSYFLSIMLFFSSPRFSSSLIPSSLFSSSKTLISFQFHPNWNPLFPSFLPNPFSTYISWYLLSLPHFLFLITSL